jgi:hypothetical protein
VAALENDNDLNNGPLISKFHDSTMLRIMATLAFMVRFDLYLCDGRHTHAAKQMALLLFQHF